MTLDDQMTLAIFGDASPALAPAAGSVSVKRDADSSRHREGSPAWRDAEARRITREDAAQHGWRKTLRRIRQHREIKALIEAGLTPFLRPVGWRCGDCGALRPQFGECPQCSPNVPVTNFEGDHPRQK
jgi:hypothetical protein